MSADTWDPAVYEQFKAERDQPFHDLLAGIVPVPGGRMVDLGCGTGELTGLAHRGLEVAETLGLDSSSAMLQRAAEHANDGLRFEARDIATFADDAAWDIVLANASLQWVPDHPRLFARLHAALRPGGQLAVQMPSNFDHPSHTIADLIGRDLGLQPLAAHEGVLTPDGYAQLLDDLGFHDIDVTLKVYLHHLPRSSSLLDWVSGSLLTHYRRALGDAYDDFFARYRAALLDAVGDPSGAAPYLFTFKRLRLHATT